MQKRFSIRLIAVLLLAAQLFVLMPAVPVTVSAAETTEAAEPVPYVYSNAAMQSEDLTMGGIAYSDAIQFTMGYTGLSNGATAEVSYNFKGKYSSLTFSAGYVSGEQRDASMTVIADGVVVKDAVTVAYTDIAKSFTVSLAGVSQLTIRFESSGYDKTRYAIANVKATAAGKVEEETLVSDEFYDIPRYLLQYTSVISEPFSMGGYDYENGYDLEMGYGFNVGNTAKLGFNFNNQYKKLTFDIARLTDGESVSYTRSAYLTIEVDGTVLAGYDAKELKYDDISLPVTVDLNGASQVLISLTSNGYDRVHWAIGNVQLVSDGKAHGILLDAESVTLTSDEPTFDLNPRVYPSDAANRKYTIESDCTPIADVDEEGLLTGYYKGDVTVTATTVDGGFTAECAVTSKLPAFMLENVYKIRYVEDTADYLDDSTEFVLIMGNGDGGFAGDLGRAYVDAGRVITDGYGGAINGLDKVLDLDIEIQNDYDILIAELFAGMMSDELYQDIIETQMLEDMSDVITYLGQLVDVPSQLLAAEAVTDLGELPDVVCTETQTQWSAMKKLFTSKVTYEDAGKMFSVLGGAVDLAKAAAEGCNNVAELMEYYVLCNAFSDANAAYAKVLQETAAKMAGENPIMGPALKDAANSFVSNLEAAANNNADFLYKACGKEIAKFAADAVDIVSDTVESVMGTADLTIWGAIRNGIKVGTSLANKMTSTDDRYFYGKMLHMAGYMAEGMYQVVMERQAAFDTDPTYENAEAFSAAVEMYLNLQIKACDYGIWYFNSYATCWLGKIKEISSDELAMANILLIYKAKLMQLRDSGQRVYFGSDGSISGFVVACPVTVTVAGKDGTVIAQMETGSLTTADGYDWAYRLMGSEHEHKAGFYDPSLHTVTITAQADGTMSVSDFTATEDGLDHGCTYVNIPIKAGETYVLKETRMVKDTGEGVNPDQKEPESYYTNPFVDVADSEFYYDAVMWAVHRTITTGTSETTFSPGETCTRGQIVTFLWRASGCPQPAGGQTAFVDVADGAYYETAVRWAVEKGITKGTSDTTFSPDEPCTRGQVVTFLWRALGEVQPGSDGNPFGDVPADQYYYNAVLWAVEKNITKGTSGTTFSPDEPCTRGQIVTFLYRALA